MHLGRLISEVLFPTKDSE